MHLCVSPDGSAEVGIGILNGSAEVGIGILNGSAEDGIGILIRRGRNWDSYPPRSELGFYLPGTDALDADATFAQEH